VRKTRFGVVMEDLCYTVSAQRVGLFGAAEPNADVEVGRDATPLARTDRGIRMKEVESALVQRIGWQSGDEKARPHEHGDRPMGASCQLLFTVAEVSQILRLSRSRVYELIYAGQLPSIKLGRSRRVRRSDVEAFVEGLEEAC